MQIFDILDFVALKIVPHKNIENFQLVMDQIVLILNDPDP